MAHGSLPPQQFLSFVLFYCAENTWHEIYPVKNLSVEYNVVDKQNIVQIWLKLYAH